MFEDTYNGRNPDCDTCEFRCGHIDKYLKKIQTLEQEIIALKNLSIGLKSQLNWAQKTDSDYLECCKRAYDDINKLLIRKDQK